VTQDTIYHLVTEGEFRAQVKGNAYVPARFEQNGFIHCTGDLDTLLAVANDYFSGTGEPVLVLVIKTAKLTAEVWFEPPVPIEGSGTSHLEEAQLFPHIYGPLNLDAVTEIGALRKSDGAHQWPDRFTTLQEWRSR
jgi:uncharacterized protein (DUF952 family)